VSQRNQNTIQLSSFKGIRRLAGKKAFGGKIITQQAEGVFRIRAARKMGREQKGGRKGVGEGKERNACPQTP